MVGDGDAMGVASQVLRTCSAPPNGGLAKTTQSFCPSCQRMWLKAPGEASCSSEPWDCSLFWWNRSRSRLLLPAITGISTAGESSSTLCAPTAHAFVLYAPESNLEASTEENPRQSSNLRPPYSNSPDGAPSATPVRRRTEAFGRK